MAKHVSSLFALLIGMVTIITTITVTIPVFAGTNETILPMKQRAAIVDRLLAVRLNSLPEKLMRREGVSMWVIIAREYNEDPIVKTMLPGTAFAARRRTILVFVDEGQEGVNGYAVSRYGVGEFFEPIWNPEEQPDQWQALADFIEEKNPANIGINTSSTSSGWQPYSASAQNI